MIALVLSTLLLQTPAPAPAPEPAPAPPPAAAPAPPPAARPAPTPAYPLATAQPPMASPAPPPAVTVAPVEKPPLWRTLADSPWFARALAGGLLGVGLVLGVVGAGALTATLALLRTPVLPATTGSSRTDLVALSELTAATGLIAGCVLIVAGVVGLVVH